MSRQKGAGFPHRERRLERIKKWQSQCESSKSRTSDGPVGTTTRLPACARPNDVSAGCGTLRPYRWVPVQVREHGDADTGYFMGEYVDTLSMNLHIGNASWQPVSLASGSSSSQVEPACCLVGGNLVLCRGLVRIVCPQDHDAQIARLPEGLRPHYTLQFCGLCESRSGASSLVTLVVTPDGWVRGVSVHGAEGAIDLSGIRFGTCRGLSITDEVRLHTTNVGPTRIVLLQGRLTERFFEDHVSNGNHGLKPLAVLPQSCRPPAQLGFVVPGSRGGGFHLVHIRPSNCSSGVGGDVVWADSIWYHDEICLSGVMYEVAPEAMQISIDIEDWSETRRQIVVSDFQKKLVRKFNSIEVAWREAFDLDNSMSINFTEFGAGCKSVGFCGNVTRLWSMLDIDGSGEITMDELYTEVGVPGTALISSGGSQGLVAGLHADLDHLKS